MLFSLLSLSLIGLVPFVNNVKDISAFKSTHNERANITSHFDINLDSPKDKSYYYFNDYNLQDRWENKPNYLNWNVYDYLGDSYSFYYWTFDYFININGENVLFNGLSYLEDYSHSLVNIQIYQVNSSGVLYTYDIQGDLGSGIYLQIETDNYTFNYHSNYAHYFETKYANINSSYYIGVSSLENNAVKNDWAVFNYIFSNDSYSFVFNDNFNYNYPYKVDRNNIYVQDSSFNSNTSSLLKLVYNGYFISGGRIFNKIQVRYFNGNGTYYKDNVSGEIKLNGNQGTGYFNFLEYVNTLTNDVIIVSYRSYQQFTTSNNGIGNYLTTNTLWESETYKTITFLNHPDEMDLNYLIGFNNSNYQNSIVNNGEYGLGGIFDLFNISFGAFLPILSIAILPNLTIGMLLFIPFVLGLIVIIFRMVRK